MIRQTLIQIKLYLNQVRKYTKAVVLAIGELETRLAKDAGLEIGKTGAIKVDRNYRTSDKIFMQLEMQLRFIMPNSWLYKLP